MVHELQPVEPETKRGYTLFLATCTLTAATIVACMGYLLFLRYSDLATSGDANLPGWIGKVWGNLAYFLISLTFMVFYLWVIYEGTRTSNEPYWRIGAWSGTVLGLLSLVLGVVLNLVTPTDPLGSGEQMVLLLLGLFASLGAGIWGMWRGGHVSAGIVAAFWSTFFQAFFLVLSTIVQDIFFAETLTHTLWAHDLLTVCRYRTGLSYESCEVGDNLGATANILAVWPLLGAIVGSISAAITALFMRQRRKLRAFTWRREGRMPSIFILIMVVVTVLELLGNLW